MVVGTLYLTQPGNQAKEFHGQTVRNEDVTSLYTVSHTESANITFENFIMTMQGFNSLKRTFILSALVQMLIRTLPIILLLTFCK